jgi:catechol 2,3-dioxygenase-like lactoylglutathione lyase family enzyme
VVSLRPSHIGLCVSDLDRSMGFYCGGLGFEPATGYDLDSATVPGLDAALEVRGPAVLRSQMIVLDGLTIELLHYTSPAVEGRPSAHRNQLGLTHLSFWVDDLAAAADRLVQCGGTILPDTRQSPGVELVFVADPDGARVELMQTARGESMISP